MWLTWRKSRIICRAFIRRETFSRPTEVDQSVNSRCFPYTRRPHSSNSSLCENTSSSQTHRRLTFPVTTAIKWPPGE